MKAYRLLDMNDDIYFPGFFLLESTMDFEKITSLDNLSGEDRGTFLHEYVHYLQDVTLPCKLYEFNQNCNLLSAMIEWLQKNKKESKGISLAIGDMFENNEKTEKGKEVNIKTMILDTILGDYYEDIVVYLQDVSDPCVESLIDDMVKEYCISQRIADRYKKYVEIKYDNKSYVFGSRCITESMAYLIEYEVYGARKRSDELPYNACELVCEKIYPKYAQNKKMIIALCELSLHWPYAGYIFCEILKKMKEKKFLPCNSSELYNFVRNYPILLRYFVEEGKELVSNAIRFIDFLFPAKNSHEYIMRTNEYFKSIILLGWKKRLMNPFLISNIAFQFDTMQSEFYYSILIEWFSMPLIRDKNGILRNLVGIDYVFPILAMKALADIFYGKRYNQRVTLSKYKCYCFEICQQHHQERFDEKICRETPWKQAELENNFCLFAYYWKYFQL